MLIYLTILSTSPLIIGVNLVKNPEIKHYPASNIFDETGIKVSKKLLIKHMLSEFKSN